MKYIIAAIVLGLLFAPQEKATLTTPIAQPSIVDVQISRITIARLPTWELTIDYIDNLGKTQVDSHQGVFNATLNPNGADVLVKALNKANLSTSSLEKRAITHLQDAAAHDGIAKVPPGAVTGSPQ